MILVGHVFSSQVVYVCPRGKGFFSVSVVVSPEHQTHVVPDPSFIGRKVQRSGAG